MKEFIIPQQLGEDDLEFMPMIPLLEDDETAKKDFAEILPILPLRNSVLYPGVVQPITVGRDKSIQALNEAYKGNKLLGVLAQKENMEDAGPNDLHMVGTVARIAKLFKMPDGSTTIIIQGRNRFKVTEFLSSDPFIKAKVELLEDDKVIPNDEEFLAMIGKIKDLAAQIIKLSPNIPTEAGHVLRNVENPVFLMHFISSNLSAEVKDKQQILEMQSLSERAKLVLQHMDKDVQFLELKNKIHDKTRTDIDKQQREYYLNQQLKAIQEELGGDDKQELKALRKRAAEKALPDNVMQTLNREFEKLERMHPASSEYSVVFNYCETVLDLPWREYTVDNFDLKHSKIVFDQDHFGLEKVKERILEYLAVLKLKGDMKSPIICLAGPPGVGKTSLGKSIARALGRKFVRMSLGGLHDEAEIRGHRKTYIGAMPGRIMQSLKKAGSANPVFLLDEIDKIGHDYKGDPSSALLEVLDPEQNNTFYDNYLELEFDLSKVLFIATANNLGNIQQALRDRLEIIEITGYSLEEKVEIAKTHLLQKQREAHGLKSSQAKLNNAALQVLINSYTRESGVRELDRQIAAVMRNTAKKIALEETYEPNISVDTVKSILGKPRFEHDMAKENNPPGVAIGLAWTAVGGDILFIEASKSEGKEGITLTGQLGDVMKESATTAISYIKSHAAELNIPIDSFAKNQIHVHVPEGATPKDGPSAGITMLTAITSLLTGRKVKPLLAMTGEITLRGKILPVGGIKEKVLAAKRAGIKEIIMCSQNEKDVEEINTNYIQGVKFHFVDRMEEVLAIALK